MVGPLTQLRIRGSVCPCMLSEDKVIAKSSDAALSSICHTVRWHQGAATRYSDQEEEEEEGNKGSAMKFFSKVLLPKAKSTFQTMSTTPITVDATWCLSDGGILGGARSNIVMEIVAKDDNEINKSPHETTLRIPLRRIGIIRPLSPSSMSMPSWASTGGEDGGSNQNHIICIYGKQSEHNPSGQGEELARLEITSFPTNGASTTDVTREEVIEHFTNMLEWDRARRKREEDDDETEQSAVPKKGMLRGKAEKAAHFAKREIEMQQRKRDREQKKAKYLKDAGGLKYTALAMANREG